jgi:hypothetical protein
VWALSKDLNTLEDWVKKYEKKAEPFELKQGFSLYFNKRRGFFCYRAVGGVFEIDHTCTNNVKEIFQIANIMAKERSCNMVRTATYRDPAAYLRLLKGKINLSLSGLRPNGKFYWVFEWATF